MTQRLIEAWLPIAALGEENMRERRYPGWPPPRLTRMWLEEIQAPLAS